jgi:hypothetical protein
MYSSGNTFLNAVVGAVASLVLVFLPFSPAVGGAAAGYLQRGSTTDGAKAGAVTGLLVAFPLFLLVVLLAPVFLFAPAGVPSIPTDVVAFVLLSTVGTLAYALGTATLGGAIGAYLAAVHHRDPATDATAATDATDATDTTDGAVPEDHTTAGGD